MNKYNINKYNGLARKSNRLLIIKTGVGSTNVPYLKTPDPAKNVVVTRFWSRVVNSFYWSPAIGSLTEYQYIKCKWLFELLTGSFTSIHKEYGFISSNGSQAGNKSSPTWPLILGHFFRFYSLFFRAQGQA